jgi:hypothetical protein
VKYKKKELSGQDAPLFLSYILGFKESSYMNKNLNITIFAILLSDLDSSYYGGLLKIIDRRKQSHFIPEVYS